MPVRTLDPAPDALTAEARFVLLSGAGSGHDAALRTLLAGDIRWAQLAYLAIHERAVSVVWATLGRLGARADSTVAETLRRSALVAGFRQQLLEDRLDAALSTLADAGVDVLLLKGSALGVATYSSFADRPMGDIDVLLPVGQVDAGYAALLDNGWVPDMTDEEEAFYREHHHLTPLVDAQSAEATLEVHRTILPGWSPFHLPTDSWWDHAVQVKWRGHRVLVPSPTHALLHVCVHYAWAQTLSHGTWRAFADLHALTSHEDVDWGAFCEAAHRARAASCCYWTLYLAARFGSVPVPVDVLRRLRPPGSALVHRLLEQHFALTVLPSERGCPSTRLSHIMWDAAVRPGWSGHGRTRPWDEKPRFHTPRPPHAMRVRSQVQRISAWRRYLAAFVPG